MAKYSYAPVNVPESQKLEVNKKLVYLIENDLLQKHDITAEEVYNTYSSIGGLHGLNFDDFSNYHEFSEEKKRFEMGQFFTPHKLSEFVVNSLNINDDDVVYDLTCGNGNFFNFVPNEKKVYGVEFENGAYQVAKFLYPEAHIVQEDIRSYEQTVKADFMILNPPFNLSFRGMSSQSYVIRKAFEGLRIGGLMAVIVPMSYLNDEFSNKTEITHMNDMFHFLGQFALGDKAFTENLANIGTKVMYFAKKSSVLTERLYSTEVQMLNGYGENSLRAVKNVVENFVVERKSKRLQIRQEEMVHLETSDSFMYKVSKYLYDIERNPKISDHFGKAKEYVDRFLNEKKPPHMDYATWDKQKITEKKVYSYLKRIISKQNVSEEDVIRVVKTQYGLKYKAYSEKTRRQLNKEGGEQFVSFKDLYNKSSHPFGYHKLIERKKRAHLNQILPYNQIDAKMLHHQRDFVENLVLESDEGEQIILNDVQQEDTIKMLSKNYGYLQWDTGSGKTVSAMAQMLYRQKFGNIRNIFVVSNAIAVNNTLEETFESYGFDVIRVKKLEHVRKIQPNQVVLMTFDALNKYKRFIKRRVRLNSQKIMFLLDEADNICNVNALRYKSVLSVFRKSKYKLLMSGTSTRNNVSEVFTAFELMYNNSENFVNDAVFLYEEPKKKTDILDADVDGFIKKVNERKGEPFSAYTKGHLEFRRSFSPSKSSVFGITKNNQGIYNKHVLNKIIGYSMITRSFEEVSHKDLYKIRQEVVSFSAEEKELYTRIMDEFHLFYDLYKSTGSSRKDSMLRIIQQLNMLLRAPVQPNKFMPGVESSKYPKLRKMVSVVPDEWVAVGATNVGVVHEYAEKLKKDFPNREIIVITGGDASLNQRKRLIKKLKETKNGILVCTQQSLSSSMNIDFVNHVVLIQMQWNFPVMKQFFTRFVRFTSLYPKTITFLLNGDSIETNLLKLLLSKEKMNRFMKNSDVDETDLYEYFGIDEDFFESLLSKKVDENGKSYIAWGAANTEVNV